MRCRSYRPLLASRPNPSDRWTVVLSGLLAFIGTAHLAFQSQNRQVGLMTAFRNVCSPMRLSAFQVNIHLSIFFVQ